MNYNKKTVSDIDVAGKKVLLRCDFNVPQDKETGAITDDKRIRAALPTIRYLLEHNAAVIACSHLGKPKGEWKEKLTLAPVAERLSALLEREVIFAKDIIGPDAQSKAAALQLGQIMLLETCALTSARKRTPLNLPRPWPIWPKCTCPTHSAPYTAPMLPLPVWRHICPPFPEC